MAGPGEFFKPVLQGVKKAGVQARIAFVKNLRSHDNPQST